MIDSIRNSLRTIILEMVGGGSGSPVAFLTPKGDPGLFGPKSIAWRVHADFVSMMIGGIGSLCLQALHPQALAGVWDHSTFRQDLKGRLGRTAFFIAATTYGPKEMALKIIEKVNKIHSTVKGTDEMGRPYCASDPQLLKWVHLTETYSFLKAYQKYCSPSLTPAEVDQYFKEMRVLGEMMGATDIPATLYDTEQAILSFNDELRYGERAKTIIDLLAHFPSSLQVKPFTLLITRAGFANLPEWALDLIQKPIPSPLEKILLSTSVNLVAIPIREALKNGVAAHSYKRVYGLN
jgi:uncharacterized protein (DUF2236 family)